MQDAFEDDTGVAGTWRPWLAEATAVTGTSAFRRPPAVDADLTDLADRKGTQALEEMERSTGSNAGGP